MFTFTLHLLNIYFKTFIYLYFTCIRDCLKVCLYIMCVCVCGASRGHTGSWIPSNFIYRQLWGAMWMLDSEPQFSESIASALNPWVIPPGPTLHFHMMSPTHTPRQKNVFFGVVWEKKTFQISDVTDTRCTIFYFFLIKSYNVMSNQEKSLRG